MTINLSPDQQAALRIIRERILGGEKETVLVGAAGTGKTTVVRELLAQLPDTPILWAAPTGKAASRLRESTGCAAFTLHSLTYRRVDSSLKLTPAEEKRWLKYGIAVTTGTLPKGVPDDMSKLEWYAWDCRLKGRTVTADLSFGDRALPDSQQGIAAKLVVVDEASMVGQQLADDFRSVLPSQWQILWLGDKSQLTPVKSSWGVDLDHPHAELTVVHRQGEGSLILAAATAVREGRAIPRGEDDRYRTGYGSIAAAARWYLSEEDRSSRTILTWRNADRVQINDHVRQQAGYTGGLVVGERLVILANRGALCNGEVYTVTEIKWRSAVWIDGDVCFVTLCNGQEILIDHQYLIHGRTTPHLSKSAVPVDFGYCLSVHKSQGSEWDDVCLAYTWQWLARKDSEQWRRLTYTAMTRAKSSLAVMEV